MPKAGIFSYPMYDVDYVISKLRAFYDVTKTNESERAVVAEALGMSSTGGGFANLISDIEKYGFVQTGGGKVTITDSGKLVLFGTGAEVEGTRCQAVTRIDLFKELYRLYGALASVEQIKAFLRQKANADVEEAQKTAPKIDTIYKKVSNYIIPAESPSVPSTTPSSEANIGRRDIVIPDAEKTQTQPLKIQYGDVYIQIPAGAASLESIRFAKEALEFMEQRILREQKKDNEAKM
jgi:hypothetical protein